MKQLTEGQYADTRCKARIRFGGGWIRCLKEAAHDAATDMEQRHKAVWRQPGAPAAEAEGSSAEHWAVIWGAQ